MAARKTGISRDLIIHPGETVKDVIEARNISQAELAEATGVSAAYISQVLNGKKGISAQFAMSLEYALDVPKSFWLNLQAHYEAEKLEADELNTITEEERRIRGCLSEIVCSLQQNDIIPKKETQDESILSLRRIFRTSNISHINGFGYDELGSYIAAARDRMAKIGMIL